VGHRIHTLFLFYATNHQMSQYKKMVNIWERIGDKGPERLSSM